MQWWHRHRQNCAVLGCRSRGCHGWHPLIFYKFVNPILLMGGRLCLPHYYCPPPSFRPSYVPAVKEKAQLADWTGRLYWCVLPGILHSYYYTLPYHWAIGEVTQKSVLRPQFCGRKYKDTRMSKIDDSVFSSRSNLLERNFLKRNLLERNPLERNLRERNTVKSRAGACLG